MSTGIGSVTSGLFGTGLPATNQTALSTVFQGQSFIQLLVSELQNQNPLSPMSSSSFIQQMTALSEMTALQQMAQFSQTTAALQEAKTAVGLIGKSVAVDTTSGLAAGTVTGVVNDPTAPSPMLVLNTGQGTQQTSLSSVVSVAGSASQALGMAPAPGLS